MASTLRNLAQTPAATEANKQAQELPSVTETVPPVVKEATPAEQPLQDTSDTGGHVVTPEVEHTETVENQPKPLSPEETPTVPPPAEKPKSSAKKKSQKAVTSEASLEEKKEETE